MQSDVALGLSHLLLDGWFMAIAALGFRATRGLPLRLGIALSLLGIAVGLPLAMVFVRAPV